MRRRIGDNVILDHRVQVTALVVLGSLLMNKPPLPETQRAIFKLEKSLGVSGLERQPLPAEDGEFFAQFSSDEDEPEAGTSDHHMSWLLHKCLRNLGVMFDNVGPICTRTSPRALPKRF